MTNRIFPLVMADLLSHYNKVPCFSLMSSRILPCNQIACEVALDAAPYYTNSAEDCAIVFCFFKDTITYSRTKRKNISRSTHHIIKTTCPIIFVYPISFGSATTTLQIKFHNPAFPTSISKLFLQLQNDSNLVLACS